METRNDRAMASESYIAEADGDGGSEIITALEKATRTYHLCPNRVWAIASNLPGREKTMPLLFPPKDEKINRMFSTSGYLEYHKQDRHDRCTFKFCERSQINFTSVPQRHEPQSCGGESCVLINNRFNRKRLDVAVYKGRSTAWHLNGGTTIATRRPFMAVSHVWSDGTGTGAWAEGQVNRCLYGFFASIARQLQCDGIWWDTLCIPRDRSARAKAIGSMHQNYAEAKVTLIHDCFLRNLEWIDAETACLAIVLSPWFSRGWTALELAKSRTVKVLFKKDDKMVLKDLDYDIIGFETLQSKRHVILADAIRQLRSDKITDLSQLLTVLGPRHTSWSRDVAIISGLLVGVPVEAAAGSTEQVYQQDIYQDILRNISTVRYGHLFHNSPTISNGFGWCPANLFDLQPSSTPESSERYLEVEPNGDIVGIWNVLQLEYIPQNNHNWKDVHPLIATKLRSALTQGHNHFFLVEPDITHIERALVARRENGVFQFIGCMYFHPPQPPQQPEKLVELRIIGTQNSGYRQSQRGRSSGLGNVTRAETVSPEGHGYSSRPLRSSGVAGSASEQYHANTEQSHTIDGYDSREKYYEEVLLKAATEGDDETVDMILQQFEIPIEMDGGAPRISQTHPNVAGPRTILEAQNANGMTPLALAAQNGHRAIVESLLLWVEVDIYSTSRPPDMSKLPPLPAGATPRGGLATPLFLAAENGHDRVIRSLLVAGANVHGVMHTERPIFAASAGGHLAAAEILLRAGADINQAGTYNNEYQGSALHLAIEKGHDRLVDLFLSSGVGFDLSEDISTHFVDLALRARNVRTLQLLLDVASGKQGWLDEPLHHASSYAEAELVGVLLRYGANPNVPSQYGGTTALHAASRYKYVDPDLFKTPMPSEGLWGPIKGSGNSLKVVELLLDSGADVNAKGGEHGTALIAAAANGNLKIAELLLKHGADIKTKGPDGTALKAAKQLNDTEIVKLLQSRGSTRFHLR